MKKEVVEIVKKAREASAPGPNGFPCKVYKKCPKLLKLLRRLQKVVWREGKIPLCWKQAENSFIPKEKTGHITQIRTISLSNVGDVFLSTDKKSDSIHDVEFNVGKARLLMTLKDSADGKVRAVELEVKRGDNSQQPKQLHN